VLQFGYFPSCINSNMRLIRTSGDRFTLNAAGYGVPLLVTGFSAVFPFAVFF
jgi:hypothetical protein